MIIKKIRIENYGKISGFEYAFNDKLNIILEDNGWGKTTLASFIKVMFYGFGGEATRSISTNERKRYMPWNKGIYGGSIIFEANGNEYELNRTFGIRAAEDAAVLRNYATGLVCEKYSIDKLGEELFGIDAQSFLRTVFIAQDRVVNDAPGGNIQTRISNMTDDTSEANNYDKIMERLIKYRRSLKSGNKKGLINEVNLDISELGMRLKEADNLDSQIQQLSAQYNEKREEQQHIRAEISRMDEEMKKASRDGEIKAKTEKYEALQNEVSELLDRLEAERPLCSEEHQIDEMLEALRQMDICRALMDDKRFTSEGEEAGINADSISEHIRKWKNRDAIITQINTLKLQCENAVMLDNMRRDETEKRNSRLRNEYLERVEKQKNEQLIEEKKQKRAGNIAMVSGIIFTLAILPAYFILSMSCSIIAVGCAVAAWALCIAIRTGMFQTPIDIIREPEYEQYVRDTRIMEYEKEIELKAGEAKAVEAQVREFIEVAGILYDEELVSSELYRLQAQTGRAMEEQQKIERYQLAEKDYSRYEKRLIEFCDSLGIPMEGDLIALLQDDKAKLSVYKRTASDYEKKLEELRLYQESLDFNPLNQVTMSDKSIDEISAIKEKLNRKQSEINDEMLECRRRLDACLEKRQQLYEDESVLEEKKNRITYLNSEYDIIVKVEEHLVNAKNNMTAKYRDPLLDAFSKYYGYIQASDLDLYDIDANINVTRQEQGARRSVDSMSRGYREMIDVALRMALVSAMYQSERPFVILDDPFVNLDTDKMAGCKELIEEIAQEYQVIYFTCHESRAFK